MKKRRLMVTIEITTDSSLAELRNPESWQWPGDTVHQVQVNAIRAEKPRPRHKRRRTPC